jgi:hypothetical protein
MKLFETRRARWLSGLIAAAICGTSAAAIGIAITSPNAPQPIVSELQIRALAKPEFAVLTRPPSQGDDGQLERVGAEPMVTGLGGDPRSARVAAAGRWGQVILTPVQLADGPAVCIFVGRSDTGGLQNCPSVLALTSGEVVLPIWDAKGGTAGFIGMVPDDISAVTEPISGTTVPVRNNVYVFEDVQRTPKRLIFAKSDGTHIDRVRLASDAPPVP